MRFLVDESTGRQLASLLQQEGYDTVYVGDVMPGAADEKIIAYAEKEKRILITDDKDFGEFVYRLQRPKAVSFCSACEHASHRKESPY